MTVRLFVRPPRSLLSVFKAMAGRARDLEPALRATVAARRESIRREFDLEAQVLPSGGSRPWVKTKDFGSSKAPSKTLQRSGALLRALLGGPGSIETYRKDGVTFGVSGAAHPEAAVLRGSSRGIQRPFRIGVTDRMRGFVGATYGVRFRRDKRFIEIPRRPHGGPTPESTSAMQRAFLSYVATGRVSTTKAA